MILNNRAQTGNQLMVTLVTNHVTEDVRDPYNRAQTGNQLMVTLVTNHVTEDVRDP